MTMMMMMDHHHLHIFTLHISLIFASSYLAFAYLSFSHIYISLSLSLALARSLLPSLFSPFSFRKYFLSLIRPGAVETQPFAEIVRVKCQKAEGILRFESPR